MNPPDADSTAIAAATPIDYKTSAYYYRCALRNAGTKQEAIDVGLHVVAELEMLKAWVRECGLRPPKWFLMQSEVDEKGWGEIVQFRSSAGLRPSPDHEL